MVVILEAIIAGSDITIDGVRIAHDAVYAALPIPLLREHRTTDAVGEVYQLQQRDSNLIAFCETDDAADDYTHVSPGLRVLSHNRTKLIEVSLVQRSKSPRTIIINRRPADPLLAFKRMNDHHHDELLAHIANLQVRLKTIGDALRLQTASERINNLRRMLHEQLQD